MNKESEEIFNSNYGINKDKEKFIKTVTERSLLKGTYFQFKKESIFAKTFPEILNNFIRIELNELNEQRLEIPINQIYFFISTSVVDITEVYLKDDFIDILIYAFEKYNIDFERIK